MRRYPRQGHHPSTLPDGSPGGSPGRHGSRPVTAQLISAALLPFALAALARPGRRAVRRARGRPAGHRGDAAAAAGRHVPTRAAVALAPEDAAAGLAGPWPTTARRRGARREPPPARRRAERAPCPAMARPPAAGVSTPVAVAAGLEPLADRHVAGLALLQHGQHRRGDEDRRVGPAQQPDGQGQPVVLEGGGAQDARPRSTRTESTGRMATKEVLIDRARVWFIERLTISE